MRENILEGKKAWVNWKCMILKPDAWDLAYLEIPYTYMTDQTQNNSNDYFPYLFGLASGLQKAAKENLETRGPAFTQCNAQQRQSKHYTV